MRNITRDIRHRDWHWFLHMIISLVDLLLSTVDYTLTQLNQRSDLTITLGRHRINVLSDSMSSRDSTECKDITKRVTT